MMTRLYDPADYDTFAKWWTGRGGIVVPKVLLPSLGVIVEDDKVMRAAAWLYRDSDSKVGWVAWTVTNPENTAFASVRAVQLLLGAMAALAEEFKLPLLYAQIQQKGLMKAFERAGFQTSHPVTQMVRLCQPPPSFST